jgi:hypothetical protein
MGISAYLGTAAAASWYPLIGTVIGGMIGAYIAGKCIAYIYNSLLIKFGYNDEKELERFL